MRIGMGWLGLGQADLSTLTLAPSSNQLLSTDATLLNALPSTALTPICPTGSTCSIVPGIPDTNIYIAVGLVAAGFLFMGMSHK
jgi:hypothetical protein